MWNELSAWIHRISNGWAAFTSLIVFLLFILFVLPEQAAKAEVTAGNAGSPDMSFYYSVDDLYQMAEAYGEEGRIAYIRARFTFDLIWPIVYTVFLAAGISWLSRKAFEVESLWQRANLVPILAALFDFLENVSTSLVMIRYPSGTPIVDVLAVLSTMAKWVLVSVCFVLLLAIGVAGIWRSINERRSW
jgi:hypothetical protein